MKTEQQIIEMFSAIMMAHEMTEGQIMDERLEGMTLAFAWTVEANLPKGFAEWFEHMLKLKALAPGDKPKRKKAKSHQISKAE